MAHPPRFGHVADFANPHAHLRGPRGKLLCRVCGTEVSGRRITFCGQPCVEAWSIRHSPGFARRCVRKRDKSVCQFCGLDCIDFKKRMRALFQAVRDRAWRKSMLRVIGLKHLPSTFWEMDHIIPVSEGGGSCGLENLRTLCLWCHRGETRKLTVRLREARKRPAH